MHIKIIQFFIDFNRCVQLSRWSRGNAETEVREVPDSNSGSGKDFFSFFFVVVIILRLGQEHYMS